MSICKIALLVCNINMNPIYARTTGCYDSHKNFPQGIGLFSVSFLSSAQGHSCQVGKKYDQIRQPWQFLIWANIRALSVSLLVILFHMGILNLRSD